MESASPGVTPSPPRGADLDALQGVGAVFRYGSPAGRRRGDTDEGFGHGAARCSVRSPNCSPDTPPSRATRCPSEGDASAARVKSSQYSGDDRHFNFSAFVSMGPVSTSITGHRYGAPRLVRGITRSLFLEQADCVLPSLRGFAEPEIDPSAASMYSGPALPDIAAQ